MSSECSPVGGGCGEFFGSQESFDAHLVRNRSTDTLDCLAPNTVGLARDGGRLVKDGKGIWRDSRAAQKRFPLGTLDSESTQDAPQGKDPQQPENGPHAPTLGEVA